MPMKSGKNKFIWGIFALYVIMMLRLLFGRSAYDLFGSYWETLQYNINLIPFYTIKNYLHLLENTSNQYLIRHAYVNLLGNVVMFVPLGFFLPVLFPKQRSFKWFLPSFCLIILLIEVIQLFTLRGSCDIDDFILNCIGGCIGYGIYKGICTLRK